MASQQQADDEELMWQWFAEAHPHEAYEQWPERFWEFFHARCPGVSRLQMEIVLAGTNEQDDASAGTCPPELCQKPQ